MTSSATRAGRIVRFRDPRPPQDIRIELEREHVVLLAPGMRDERLVLAADAQVNGAPYRVELVFDAALDDANCYTLAIDIDWQDQPPNTHDYHRKSAPGWLDSWTARYAAGAPPPSAPARGPDYDERAGTALAAESGLTDVAAVQRAIVAGLQSGGTYAPAHKEGGTRIAWQGGRFVRVDYGEHEARHVYADDGALLAGLRQLYEWRISRSALPGKVDELTAWKLVLRLMEPTAGAAHSLPASARPRRPQRLASLAVGALLAGTLAWTVLSHAFGVKSVGAPASNAAGTSDTIAMLISTQTSYLPSLHRDPTRDRFRLSLLLVPRAGGGEPRRIALAGEFDASQSLHAARMLGFDGRLIWFVAGEIGAWDTKARRLLGLADLRRANPGLDALWPIGHYEMANRLVVSTRDNRLVVEVDPDTLVASTLSAPPRRRALPPHPAKSLLLPGPVREDGALEPAFVREAVDAPALRLNPSGARLVTFWRKTPDLQRMLYVARIDDTGTTVWETRTGIADLQQVMPDPLALALVGTRPRTPGKVPEPVLVILRNDTGAATAHSLFVRD